MSTDMIHDILDQRPHPLDFFFHPKHVAVIGASEKALSVGRTLVWNLISSPFGGAVYPVNPRRSSILGIKAYPNIKEVPAQIDLAVIATPAPTIAGIIKECVEAKVKAAIIISAGFKELGKEGEALEKEIARIIEGAQLRIIGPNCLGVMSALSGLNATFAKGMVTSGKVTFLSQSGALLTAVLDWSRQENVGFRACVSLGSMLDVSWGDLIDYFGRDPHTESILIYMESIGDARRFLSAAREVALSKPIIIIKAGRTDAAAKAAASHTGSMTGSDEVLDAAFERVGILRVNTISELFDMAAILSKQPRPKGPRLSLITNAGGPAVLATDELIQSGGALAEISSSTKKALDAFLPASWSHNNPIDILGDADASRYKSTLEAIAQDDQSDGLLIVLTPQDMTEPEKTAEVIAEYAKNLDKPLLASWMGGAQVNSGVQKLNESCIPTFSSPDKAAKAFCYMWRYADNLKSIYETPTAFEEREWQDDAYNKAQKIITKVLAQERWLLSEIESKELLKCYKIPTTDILFACDRETATQAAEKIGYPVALKLISNTITHKSDFDGVQLNLQNSQEVKLAFEKIRSSLESKNRIAEFQGVSVQNMVSLKDSYELLVGSSCDEQFGPVIMCGSGGFLVEIYKDYRLALPPLNTTLAKRMLEKTRIYKALQGFRGRGPTPLKELEQLLVRFSQLVVENPQIIEVEINPLLVSENKLIALDARVILGKEKRQQVAIRPYPKQYIRHHTLKDGMQVRLRPIRPEDEPRVVAFYQTLSNRPSNLSLSIPRSLQDNTTHERMVRVCCSDYDRDLAVIVEPFESTENSSPILAIGRLSRLSAAQEANFTLLVSEKWQNRGLGTWLLGRLQEFAKEEGLCVTLASMSFDNKPMQHICQKLGFTLKQPSNLYVEASYKIN